MTLICRFDGCGRNSHRGRLCSGHRAQKKRGEELHPLNPIGYKPLRALLPNPTQPGTLLIPLTRGYFAIIDEADGTAVGGQNWQVKIDPKVRAIYAIAHVRGGSQKLVRLHRFLWALWGMPDTPEIDHENRNGLDCRRENLRAATSSQNKFNVEKRRDNTSGIRGVCWSGRDQVWRATFMGKSAGSYATKAEAAAAYARASAPVVGEFAVADAT